MTGTGSVDFGVISITPAVVFVRSICVDTASAVPLGVVIDGDANEVGVSSMKAEVFMLSFHLPFDPAPRGDDELHLENGSNPLSAFFTSPFILPEIRARSSVVAAESFGISTFPVVDVVYVPPGVVDQSLQKSESATGFTDESTLSDGIDFTDAEDTLDWVNSGVWDDGVVFNTDTWEEAPFCCDMP